MHNNNTIIPTRNIGETPDVGLQCITDKISCCKRTALGAWFFLNHKIAGDHNPFFVTRNNDGAVILNHHNSTLSPTGLTYCAIPDATGAMQRVYAHIGKLAGTK